MSATRLAPARLLVSLALAVGLTLSLLTVSAVGPTTSTASAFTTAAKARAAASWAKSRKGSPYVYGATGPHRFDCSGLTRWVYAHVGKSLPHSSARQVNRVEKIWHRSRARRGDLVFFYNRGGVYHVGIYAGHGYLIHAPYPGAHVRRERIWSGNVFYGRVR